MVATATTTGRLLDQYGDPIQAATRPEAERFTLGSIRDRFYAYPAQGLTPERLATILKEADQGDLLHQAELFLEMMERDAKLQSLFQTRRMAVAGLDWRIEPSDDSPVAASLAVEVEEALEGLALQPILHHLLDAIAYGYAGVELLWQAHGGRTGIGDLLPVPVRRLTYLPRGAEPIPAAPRLITDQEPIFGIDLPPWKFVIHTPRAISALATRSGLMRTCAWLYLFKHYSIKDWVAFSEVYGMPLRLGKYQPGAAKEDRDALLRAVRSIGHDAAGIISSSTEIEFIQAAQRQSPDLYEALINLLNKELAQAVLGQTLTSDVGSVGSLAAAQVHDEVRFDIMTADAAALSATLTAQLIRPLVGFTYGWEIPTPRFAFKIEEPRDQASEATVLKALVEAGFGRAIPLAIVQERFGIRPPAEGEETVGAPPPGNPPSPPLAKGGTGGFGGTALKALSQVDPAADETRHMVVGPIEGLRDHMADAQWAEVMVPLLEPVHALAQQSTTLSEFRSRLAEAYRQADPALLERAMTVAMQWGWIQEERRA